MLSLSRFTAALTLDSSPLSSPLSHQLNPYSFLGEKRATCAAVLADASNLQAVQATPIGHPPVPTCRPSEVTHTIIHSQQSPSLPYPDISNDTGENSTAKPHTSHGSATDRCTPTPISYFPTSSFPVLGPFDILGCVQRGGYGTTWAAKDRSTCRLLCLKGFDLLERPDITSSVEIELKTFMRMVESKGGERGNQFLMSLNRSIRGDRHVFFAMELMTINLAMYMFVQPERCKLHARRWMAQTALGIQSLHDMGIFHRDIKPENILIDSRENVRIIDFGLSYLDPTDKPLCQGSGYAADFLGTAAYMAPEVLWNKDLSTDERWYYGIGVDWWALGCLLFELESPGHQPLFSSAEQVDEYIKTQSPFPLEQPYADFENLGPVVVDLLEGLLRVRPEYRYSLKDMEKHDYFLHRNGTNEFDNAAIRALDRPVRPELVPRFTGDDEPIGALGAARLSSEYDWINHKWACLKDAS